MRVPVTLAVTVTIAAALAFQPLRRRLESAVSRRLFGDRVQQYQLLKNLGTTMEQTAELDELLPRLAHAVRDGIGASWVQVRLRDADGSWLDEPVGVAGEVTGESAAGVDLVRAGEQVGRIDLGPKPGGYAAADLELLATVAAQATTAVANVRLATQLKEGLEQLSTSRVRLIAAQDAERRRIERDLHDGIQQEVVALIAGLRLARNQAEPQPAHPRRTHRFAGSSPRDARGTQGTSTRHPPAGTERQRARCGTGVSDHEISYHCSRSLLTTGCVTSVSLRTSRVRRTSLPANL